jgi:ankyrin repeat protein
MAKLLLANPQVDPTINFDSPFRSACHYRHLKIIELLLSDPRVDPECFDNGAIRYACYHVNILPFRNYLINVVCKYGHIEVVKLLLEDDRIDPSCNNNTSIYTAYRKQHYEIVKLLFNNEDVYSSLSKDDRQDYRTIIDMYEFNIK